MFSPGEAAWDERGSIKVPGSSAISVKTVGTGVREAEALVAVVAVAFSLTALVVAGRPVPEGLAIEGGSVNQG